MAHSPTLPPIRWRAWAAAFAASMLAAMPGLPAEPARARLDTLASFKPANGQVPLSGVLAASDGNYYGTTSRAGKVDDGTIYRITPAGKISRMHTFSGPDGRNPIHGLIQANNGDLYGTTYWGGDPEVQQGVVYRISLAGDFQVLHVFRDSGRPNGPLIQARDGWLYGVVSAYDGDHGFDPGDIYRISLDGSQFEIVASLTMDVGDNPYGALLEGDDGRFYGTAIGGGPHNGGTIYTVTPAGELALVHGFDNPGPGEPTSGLVYSGSHDRMLGVTSSLSSIYQLKDGQVTILQHLDSTVQPLALGPDGVTFYGLLGNQVFAYRPGGKMKFIATFKGDSDSEYTAPAFSLAGTTLVGTSTSGGHFNQGTVFAVTGF